MACTLPTLDKTWEFNVNYEVPYSTNTEVFQREKFLQSKNVLIDSGSFTSPWIVESCSDSSTVVNNNPATADLWILQSDVVRNTSGPHSWIVLKQPGVNSGGLQMCWDYSKSANNQIDLMVSPSAGFGSINGGTDGTTSARPTATDEYTLLAGDFMDGSYAPRAFLHVQISDDGQCTRFQIAEDNRIKTFMLIDAVKDPRSDWTEAVGAMFSHSAAGTGVSYTSFSDAASYKTRVDGDYTVAYVTSIGDTAAASGQYQTVPHDLTGCWEMYECGLWAPDTQFPAQGRLGKFYDFRWVSTALGVGDTFPQSGTLYQWMVIGDFAIPWNQTSSLYSTS